MTTRVSIIGEIVLFFAIACIFGYVLNGGNWAFVGSQLHPFLVVIAFHAISHGLTEALLATVIAVVLYFLGGATLSEGGPHGKVIFSFVLTGVVLGLAMHTRNRQLSQTRSELEEIRNEGERLRQRLQVVNAANQKLNERILGEVSTVQSFADIARRLSVLEEKDLYPAICDLTRDFLHAQEASVYMRDGDKLVLTAQKGWDSIPKEAMALFKGKDLLWTSMEQGKAMTALDMDMPAQMDPTDLSRRYRRLMCVPITHPQTHQAVGVISVDRMPFSEFHGSSLGMLNVISKWASDSLYNASTFQEVVGQLAGDDVMPNCVPPVVFRDRLSQEQTDVLGAAAGAEAPGFVCCTLQGLQVLPAEEQVALRQAFYSAVSPLLTQRTVLGRLRQGVYGILLPDSIQPTGFRDDLVKKLQQSLEGVAGTSKVTVLAGASGVSSDDDVESLIRTAQKNLVRC